MNHQGTKAPRCFSIALRARDNLGALVSWWFENGASVVTGRRDEAADALSQEAGDLDGGAVAEFGTDDLHADRQAFLCAAGGRDRCRQIGDAGQARPEELVPIGPGLAID